MATNTRKLLSDLQSSDQFEELATAVLRAASATYVALAHVGTNADGRAVRSPVDGISITVDTTHRRLILVQHTITARKDLRRKWLESEKGDLAKSLAIAHAERARRAIDDAVLVLTASHEPDEELIRDVYAAAGTGLRIDLWPASRIAAFLDEDPEGQWIRSQQFTTEQSRLSQSRLQAIARASLAHYLPLAPREAVVPRAVDAELVRFVAGIRGAGFLIGESGLGKSTALRRLADNWLRDGGNALVMAHEVVEQSTALEQAIATTLRHWSPALEPTCGYDALALASPEQPLLLIVEDVNLSSNPRRLLERLLGWSQIGRQTGDRGHAPTNWRLLCPVWRSNTGLADTQLSDRVMRDALLVGKFERAESAAALAERACAAGQSLTPLQLNELANALDDDPLLIGLNQDWSHPSPNGAIASYIAQNIEAAADGMLLVCDVRSALQSLAERIVQARELAPSWGTIRDWFREDPDTLRAIRRLVEQGRILQLGESTRGERLGYRHDRLRDHLLSGAIQRLIASEALTETLWTEPFYAGLIGKAAADLPDAAVERIAAHNPPALFAALQDRNLDESRRNLLVTEAGAWTHSNEFACDGAEQQLHHAMHYLARTDGTFVRPLAEAFPATFPRLEALVRNGDARAGASLCYSSDPGVTDGWRDRLIAHALERHSGFISNLAQVILDPKLPPHLLEGALNLAGEIGSPALCDALAARWRRSPELEALSTGWLWAVLRCCPPIAHPLSDELCDLWSSLPAKGKSEVGTQDRNPRWDIAGYSLPRAFARKPETSAVDYLIAQAKTHRRLEHVVSTILTEIDTPEAILFTIKIGARISRRVAKNKGISFFDHHLAYIWSPDHRGGRLSEASRHAAEQIWRNRRNNRFKRQIAFLVWKQTPTPAEIAALPALEKDPVLADEALRTRLTSGDHSAVALLKQRLWGSDRAQHWWYQARRVGLDGLYDDIARFMAERRVASPAPGQSADGDNIVAELLMDARDEFAVHTLIANWDHLRTSPNFVQAALYLAVPATLALANAEIAATDEPARLLEHIDMRWGVKTYGRPGITEIAQLRALEPHLAHMGKMRLTRFFEVANARGALAWRKQHLDPLIAETNGGYRPGSRDALLVSLDAEVRIREQYKRDRFNIDWWFRRREEELWDRATLLGIVSEWSHGHGARAPAELLIEALTSLGERRDLILLDRIHSDLAKTLADRIANCRYAVRRRSLTE